MEGRHLMALACLFCFASMAAAVPGRATSYPPPYTPSTCFGPQDKGSMVAAVSDAIWANGAACGRRYRVTCTGAVPQPCKGGSVVVTVVDQCPAPCQGTFDLSRDAFNAIAAPNAGVINIDYQQA